MTKPKRESAPTASRHENAIYILELGVIGRVLNDIIDCKLEIIFGKTSLRSSSLQQTTEDAPIVAPLIDGAKARIVGLDDGNAQFGDHDERMDLSKKC